MDTIERPLGTTAATTAPTQPIDFDEPHGDDAWLRDRNGLGATLEEDPMAGSGFTAGSTSSSRLPVSPPRSATRQAILFTTAALLVFVASAGVIFHKPLLAAWVRFREHHALVAASVPLPRPRSTHAVLTGPNAVPGTTKPLNNGIPGLSVVPSYAHQPGTSPSTKPPSPKPTDGPISPSAVSTQAAAMLTPAVPAQGAATAQKPLAPTVAGSPPAKAAVLITPAVIHRSASIAASTASSTASTGAPGASAVHLLVGPMPAKGTLQSIPHPVQAAAKLVAAPASRQDEIETNSLVAGLAQLVGELRSQNLEMENQINVLEHHVDARMMAFNQRLTYDQAHDSLVLAAAPHPATAVVPVRSAQIFPTASRHVAPVTPTAYHVLAASTGLAMIVRDGTTYEVSVGSVVPGVGRVISIVESGSRWVVRTDHGLIR